MRCHHLFTDADGESHWRTAEIALTEKTFAPPAEKIEVSDPEAASAVLFLRLRRGWNEPVHPTPVRQYLTCLRGTAQVTASDGEARLIGPGDVWFMEDRSGEGHHTQVVSEDDFECVIVQLPDV